MLETLLSSLPLPLNGGDLAGLLCLAFILLACARFFFSPRPKNLKESQESQKSQELPKEIPKEDWSSKLKKGLSSSHSQVWGKLSSLFQGNAGLDSEQLENMEELLYGADIGPSNVRELIEQLKEKAQSPHFQPSALKPFLFDFLKSKMEAAQSAPPQELYQFKKLDPPQTKVIMIVGVNGSGKTTTIGKLATHLTSQGAKVVIGAGDTFRAAAMEQLSIWSERSGALLVQGQEASSPSGVAYEALQKALNEKADYCLLDTAGRLPHQENLMSELSKFKRVLGKLDSTAPHHTLLILDAITGQNAIAQAHEFNKALQLTGIIFTKCDSSSKAGSAVSIVNQLKLPITHIGVGEKVEDLNPFNLDDYLKALLDYP